MDLSIGKKIFDGLISYPLPQNKEEKDYIFFVFTHKDGYYQGAKSFFDRYYKNHIAKELKSLEEIIDFLHNEVEKNKNLSIREIILVAHGTSDDLKIPIFNNKSNLISAYELYNLQLEILKGNYVEFNRKRKNVVKHINEKSWITIRACRFGLSNKGMFGFYSFWGGKANLYAPIDYQFFGPGYIGANMYFKTYFDAFIHLVKQRFLPDDRFSKTRKEKIISSFISSSGYSSKQFVLISKKQHGTDASEINKYNSVIQSLKSFNITEYVKNEFNKNGFDLSPHARVSHQSDQSSSSEINVNDFYLFFIKDSVKINEVSTAHATIIEYRIKEVPNNQNESLVVHANIVDAISNKSFIPIQSFCDFNENRKLKGFIKTIGEFDINASDSVSNEEYMNIINVLNEKNKAEIIKMEIFNDISFVEEISTGIDKRGRSFWLIDAFDSEANRLAFKLYEDVVVTGKNALKQLNVYKHFFQSIDEERFKLLLINESIGIQPDSPGVEIAAYLDRFSISDLEVFIEFIKHTYTDQKSILINDAKDAINRKKRGLKIYENIVLSEEVMNNPLFYPLDRDEYSIDSTDRRWGYYTFEFNSYWKEVKSSSPPLIPVKNDLFLEQKLEEVELQKIFLDVDSPDFDHQEFIYLEQKDKERFFEVIELFEKIDVSNFNDNKLSCNNFEIAIKEFLKNANTKIDLNLLKDKLKIVKFPDEKIGILDEPFIQFLIKSYNLYSVYSDVNDYFQFFFYGKIPKSLEILERVLHVSSNALTVLGFVELCIAAPGILYEKFSEEYINAEKSGYRLAFEIGIQEASSKIFDYFRDHQIFNSDSLRLYIGMKRRDLQEATANHINYSAMSYLDFAGAWIYYMNGIILTTNAMIELWDDLESIIMREIFYKNGLDACKVRILKENGFFDINQMKILIMQEVALLIDRKISVDRKSR